MQRSKVILSILMTAISIVMIIVVEGGWNKFFALVLLLLCVNVLARDIHKQRLIDRT